MRDRRIESLAAVLVRYSVAARRGQTVGVESGTVAEPLVMAVCEELLRAGAFPAVRLSPANLTEAFLRLAQPRQLRTLPAADKAYARAVDSTIAIRAEVNTRALSSVPSRRQALLQKTRSRLSELLIRKPWVVTIFPTEAYAQDAEMSLSQFEDFVYGAVFADEPDPVAAWKELGRGQRRLIASLRGADRIRIVGPGTDLAFSVKGRVFINSDGHHNMPSGEVFTGPRENSVDGVIEYDYPVCRGGQEVDGIRLVFRKGVVVEASARKNEGYLKAMLDSDAGARRVGEFGIGTNRRIQRFTKQILFDEKIGGTVHLALGRAYPETGGTNRSALHWDMIKDLRRGGAIYVNGRIFQKDGQFV